MTRYVKATSMRTNAIVVISALTDGLTDRRLAVFFCCCCQEYYKPVNVMFYVCVNRMNPTFLNAEDNFLRETNLDQPVKRQLPDVCTEQ